MPIALLRFHLGDKVYDLVGTRISAPFYSSREIKIVLPFDILAIFLFFNPSPYTGLSFFNLQTCVGHPAILVIRTGRLGFILVILNAFYLFVS